MRLNWLELPKTKLFLWLFGADVTSALFCCHVSSIHIDEELQQQLILVKCSHFKYDGRKEKKSINFFEYV